MIKLKDVSKFYYNKGIITSGFNKVSLEFNLGEFVVITGESGSGKSTLLNVISGLDSYEEGEMFINGKETSHYTEENFEDYRKKYISNIFQNFNLVNSYTVYQNIELVLLINGSKKKDIKSEVIELIKSVDLYKYRHTKVSKLSGGQKQRVAIARALAKNTPIIIADEPTGNLDSKSALSVMKTLAEVAKDKLVIIVTHNYEQMSEYATRKITMHDGKVIEDKLIKKTDAANLKIVESKNKSITLGNKIRLGMRNAFNIKPKFILLLIVYLFVAAALIAEISSFQKDKYNEKATGYNSFFVNKSSNRIIVKKNDNSAFTEEDYKKIESLSNIDYIVKNDIELDSNFDLSNNDLYFSALTAYDIINFKLKLKAGRTPSNSNGIIIVGNKDDYYLKNAENVINKEVVYSNNNTGVVNRGLKFTIVGVAYSKDLSYGNYEVYGNGDFLNIISRQMIIDRSSINLTVNNHLLSNPIIALDRIPEGTVYVPEDFNIYCKNSNCLNKELTVNIKSLYYNKNVTFKVGQTYNAKNVKSKTGISDYDSLGQPSIFMNSNDYYNLADYNNYQSSVFVKDAKNIEETSNELENNNYNSLIVSKTLVGNNTGFIYILNIITVIVTGILIVVMFFISYFIIKIILKSRNIYYSTLRILGSNKKTAKKLLEIELLTITNLACIIIACLIVLINKNIIVSNSIKNLLSFMNYQEYLFIYLALIIMTYLISLKFSKSLFKKTAMKTYNEEA